MSKISWYSMTLAFFLFVCGGCSSGPPAPAEAVPPPTEPDIVHLDRSVMEKGLVTIGEVISTRLPEILKVAGRVGVDENHTATVGAITEGRIVRILANVGDQVHARQDLAHLHSREAHMARAGYAKAQARLNQLQAELDYSRKLRERVENLYKLKAASLEQLQRAETDLRQAEMAVVVARAELGSIEEQLRELGVTAEGAFEEYGHGQTAEPGEYDEGEVISVTAPLKGSVLKRMVSAGSVVTPADDLFVISDLSRLWVVAAMPEKYLPMIKVGQDVSLTVRAYGQRPFPARITLVGDVLDPVTRTAQVRCVLDNSSGELKPEMYATIMFELEQSESSLMVPAAALQDINGQPSIFVSLGADRFRAVSVRPGRKSGDMLAIAGDIKPGDRIAVDGSFLLKSELLKSSMAAE